MNLNKELNKLTMGLIFINNANQNAIDYYIDMFLNSIGRNHKIAFFYKNKEDINIGKEHFNKLGIYMINNFDKKIYKTLMRSDVEHMVFIEQEINEEEILRIAEMGLKVFCINCVKINQKNISLLEDTKFLKTLNLNNFLIKNKLENF